MIATMGLTIVFLVGTWLGGWLAIPIVALAWGIVARAFRLTRSPAFVAAAAAALAWGTLLIYDATRGPVLTLASTLGRVTGGGGAAMVMITLLFPALLACGVTAMVTALWRSRSN